jgi:hypothetical protein
LMPKVDAIIWTAEPGGLAATFAPDIVNRVRTSFGTDMWERMSVFFKIEAGWYVEPMNANGKKPEEIQEAANFWKETLYEVEFNGSVSSWENVASSVRTLLETEMNQIPHEAALLDSDYWGMLKADVPIEDQLPEDQKMWATFLNDKRGIARLVDFSNNIEQIRAQHGTWDIKNIMARFGPSEVFTNHSFKCGWPKHCSLRIDGTYLSDKDEMRLFPADHTCGSAFDASFLPPFASTTIRPVYDENEDKFKMFQLGQANLLGEAELNYRVCYCEYGHCEIPQRFSMDAGVLSVEPVKCEVPCPLVEDKFTLPAEFCGAEVKTILSGQEATYTCATGYGHQGDVAVPFFKRACRPDGDLDPEQECTPVRCEAPDSYPRASRQYVVPGQEFRYPDPQVFKCDSGYTVDGNPEGSDIMKLQCTATAEWKFLDNPDESLSDFKMYGCRKWTVGNWGDCDATCGDGSMSRSVECHPAGAVCFDLAKPASSKKCTGISGCPDCGVARDIPNATLKYHSEDAMPLLRTLAPGLWYQCDKYNGYTLTGEEGLSNSKTTFQALCIINAPQQKAELVYQRRNPTALIPNGDIESKGCRRWESTDWSECSVTCGGGFKSRVVQCSTGIDEDCSEDAKPRGLTLTQPCYAEKVCPTQRSSFGVGSGSDAASARVHILIAMFFAGLAWQ